MSDSESRSGPRVTGATPRLRELRESLEISRAEFARRAGLTERTVRLIEAGERSPRLVTARRIAATLGTRIEVVFPPVGDGDE
ncbi:MAG: helix-turn-helix transcriptional regulator [Solirubrobacteraceae bacterium]